MPLHSWTAAGRAPTYLVTGGAGFIGVHLCRALVASGCKVRVIDNFSSPSTELLPAEVACETGDVRDHALVGRAFEAVDGCFHFAAVTSEEAFERDEQESVNRLGTAVVLNTAFSVGVPVVMASSAAVYGEVATLPVGEETEPRPISNYGSDKLFCETLANDLSSRGLSCSILRLFNIYGAGQRRGLIPHAIGARGGTLDVFGDGLQTRDFVYVDDAVAVACAAMPVRHSPRQMTFNVSTGRATSVRDVIELLTGTFQVNFAVRYRDRRLGDLLHSQGDPARCLASLGVRCAVELDLGLARMLRAEPRDQLLPV